MCWPAANGRCPVSITPARPIPPTSCRGAASSPCSPDWRARCARMGLFFLYGPGARWSGLGGQQPALRCRAAPAIRCRACANSLICCCPGEDARLRASVDRSDAARQRDADLALAARAACRPADMNRLPAAERISRSARVRRALLQRTPRASAASRRGQPAQKGLRLDAQRALDRRPVGGLSNCRVRRTAAGGWRASCAARAPARGQDFAGRQHLVDQPAARRGCGPERLAEQQPFGRHAHGRQAAAAAGWKPLPAEAEADERQLEAGILRGVDEIAVAEQRCADADRPQTAATSGFSRRPGRSGNGTPVHRCRPADRPREFAEIIAGREAVLAAGDQQHTHGRVVLRAEDRIGERAIQFVGQGVAPPGPITRRQSTACSRLIRSRPAYRTGDPLPARSYAEHGSTASAGPGDRA